MGLPLTHDARGMPHDTVATRATPPLSFVVRTTRRLFLVLGESDVGRPLLLVFSDGLDSSSWLLSEEVLDIARRCDVVAYGVSVGRTPKSDFLRDLSDVTGGTHIEIQSTKDLSATFLSVLDEFRHRYVVSYSPRGVSKEGWHQLTVRVKGRTATVKARSGYFAGS